MKNKSLIFVITFFLLSCGIDTKKPGNHKSNNLAESKELGVFMKQLYVNKSIFYLEHNKYSMGNIWLEKVWGYNERQQKYIIDTLYVIIFEINNNPYLYNSEVHINGKRAYWYYNGIYYYIDSIPRNKFNVYFNNEDSITVFP